MANGIIIKFSIPCEKVEDIRDVYNNDWLMRLTEEKENKITKSIFNNTYYLHTELSIIQIDKITIALIPGEIFPELVWGGTVNNPDIKNVKEKDNENSICYRQQRKVA